MTRTDRRRLGQHFLSLRGGADRVVRAIDPHAGERFLEVGPGKGAITFPLLQSGVRLLAVEIDPALAERLREATPAGSAFELIEADLLRLDLSELLERHLPPGREIRVAANLPYSVASPILLRLLDHADRFADLTVMVQREVADRILAPPGPREYGILTLLCAARARSGRLLDLAPSCFSPPPAVRSTLIRLTPRDPPLLPADRFPRFERTVKAAFSSRRKKLRNSLAGGSGLPAREAEAWIRAAGLDPESRPETIDLEGFLELALRAPS